jgi:O-antigen/teichoic acid export membrane protein
VSILAKYLNNVRALQFLQLFRFIALLLIGIVLSKTNIGISQIGTYETFLLISGAACFFWTGGMLQTMLSMKREQQQGKTEAYFNIFLIFTVLALITALAVFLLQSQIASFVGFSGNRIPYLKILLVYIALSCPANLVEYIYLVENKPYRIAVYGAVVFTLQILAVTIPVIMTDDLGYGLYGLLLATAVRFVWLAIVVLRYSRIRFSGKYMGFFLKLSGPFILSVLIVKGIQYADSFLVSYRFDEGTYAMFRYGAKEFPLILLPVTAFSEAMSSRIANNGIIAESLESIKRENRHLMHIFIPAAMIAIIASKYLYPLVFNEDFYESALIFNIYCFASVFRFITPECILVGKRQSRPILAAAAVNILLNIVLGLVLMNFIGIIGVAIAFLLGNLTEKLILVSVVKSIYGIRLREYMDTRIFVYYFLLMTASLAVSIVMIN